MATKDQIGAMTRRLLITGVARIDNVTTSMVRTAIDTADRELHAGQTPIYAVNAATAMLRPDLIDVTITDANMLEINDSLRCTLDGLMAADAVNMLGPEGVLPIGDGFRETALEKIKRERKAARDTHGAPKSARRGG